MSEIKISVMNAPEHFTASLGRGKLAADFDGMPSRPCHQIQPVTGAYPTRYGLFLWYPMSAQPPHHQKASFHNTSLRLFAAIGCLVLAGCATQSDPQRLALTAPSETEFPLVGDRHLRSQYLNKVSSDPLGAYLAANDLVNRPHATGLASTALNYLGIKYRLGGNTPSQGFDCSGLVRYAAEQSLGLKLPRRSAEMARLGESIKRSELERGDLVFFNTLGKRFSHVGIYLGDGKFVHAPRTGSKVRVESMNISYWQKRYNGARRLAGLAADTQTAERITKVAAK